jgi:hypothetical protein
MPKYVDEEFVPRNNYYIVTDGTRFYSYSIKAKELNPEVPIIRLERSPPVLMEGYAVLGRRVYLVSRQDLLRKVVRKSKEIVKESTTNDATNINSTVAAAIARSAVSNPDEPGLSEAAQLEITKNADAAWKEQVGTLLSVATKKEVIDFFEKDPSYSDSARYVLDSLGDEYEIVPESEYADHSNEPTYDELLSGEYPDGENHEPLDRDF